MSTEAMVPDEGHPTHYSGCDTPEPGSPGGSLTWSVTTLKKGKNFDYPFSISQIDWNFKSFCRKTEDPLVLQDCGISCVYHWSEATWVCIRKHGRKIRHIRGTGVPMQQNLRQESRWMESSFVEMVKPWLSLFPSLVRVAWVAWLVAFQCQMAVSPILRYTRWKQRWRHSKQKTND